MDRTSSDSKGDGFGVLEFNSSRLLKTAMGSCPHTAHTVTFRLVEAHGLWLCLQHAAFDLGHFRSVAPASLPGQSSSCLNFARLES